ncbi:hypothetical protein BC830DRAFT_957629 [Chytriomyces sp. MP71]|nr:hypothetical protein BC830DRAFT_957629 [Chytriomyces sp. MP71]
MVRSERSSSRRPLFHTRLRHRLQACEFNYRHGRKQAHRILDITFPVRNNCPLRNTEIYDGEFIIQKGTGFPATTNSKLNRSIVFQSALVLHKVLEVHCLTVDPSKLNAYIRCRTVSGMKPILPQDGKNSISALCLGFRIDSFNLFDKKLMCNHSAPSQDASSSSR